MLFKVIITTILFLFSTVAASQEIGDSVILESNNSTGVPIHPADQKKSFVRWPNGSSAVVTEVGTRFRIRASDGAEGWVAAKYISVMPENDIEEDGVEQLAYIVGTWNIEHFKAGAKRGFPENTRGGPSYPQHDRDLAHIARVIRDELGAAVLVLNEINGVSDSAPTKSNELDALLLELGSSWQYMLSTDGGSERIAILFDSTKAGLGTCHEFPNASGARDHFGCSFFFKHTDNSGMNDLVVIGVHLKSGQNLNIEHNSEMADLLEGFAAAFDGKPFSKNEKDIVIMGGFNSNFYDTKLENFWKDFGGSEYDIDVLAPDDVSEYQPTRLEKVPLRPNSIIDYIMATTISDGIVDDLVRSTAHVHDELLSGPFENFRRVVSDHIPVTIRIRIRPDDD